MNDNKEVKKTRGFISKELLKSFGLVQFIGVTGVVIGLAFSSFGSLSPGKLMGAWGCVAVAYSSLFLIFCSVFKVADAVEEEKIPKAIQHISAIIMMNVLLLSALVFLTGGATGSVFTPVFLLIPTVAMHYSTRRVAISISMGSLLAFTALCFFPFKGDGVLDAAVYAVSSGICMFTALFCYSRVSELKEGGCESPAGKELCRQLHGEEITVEAEV